MSKPRYVGIDTAKGFGIFMMIFIHAIIQEIGHYEGQIFISIVQNVSPFFLIFIVPIALLSIMGTFFLFANSVSITTQMLRLDQNNPDKLVKSLFNRVLSSILFITLVQLTWPILNTKYFKQGYFSIPTIYISYGADTVNAIAFSAIIIAFLLFLLLKIIKIRNKKWILIIFLSFTVIWFIFSTPMTIWGQSTMIILQEKELLFLRYCLSMFAQARFKLFQTLGFGFLGVSFGCLFELNVSKQVLRWFSVFINAITLPVFIIWVIIDPTFLLDFTSEAVPLPLQILCLGLETIWFLYFVIQCDYGTPENQFRHGKRMTWLRRYSLISLTAYAFNTYFNDEIMKIFSMIFGSSIDRSSGTAVLAWNWYVIILFLITVILSWEILIRVWEKLNFICSLEWFLSKILSKSSYSRAQIRELLYVTPPKTKLLEQSLYPVIAQKQQNN